MVSSRTSHTPTVHPRARGERVLKLWSRYSRNGSSPRARGTASLRRRYRVRCRFIPARAGNGCRYVACVLAIIGSSPRARGTGGWRQSSDVTQRFIPARAGNGSRASGHATRTSVHPRARGERGIERADGRSVNGSSPRARGTAFLPDDAWYKLRFIPARAGNGADGLLAIAATTVHPRARGERGRHHGIAGGIGGSSPRARGTGFRSSFVLDSVSVHPRARGERYPTSLVTPWQGGSSPRARGTDAVGVENIKAVRFIPARAGNGLVPTLRHQLEKARAEILPTGR